LLIDGFWCDRARTIIQQYIWFLNKENPHWKEGEIAKGVHFKDVQALNRSDLNIQHLYLGTPEGLEIGFQAMADEVPEQIRHPHLSLS